MADSKVGTFNSGTGAVGTTVQVTGVGFQPTAALFFSGYHSSDNGVHGRFMFGFASGAAEEAYLSFGMRGSGILAQDTGMGLHNEGCIASMDFVNPSVNGVFKLQSFDADGFTLEVVVQFPADIAIKYLALNATNAKVVEFTTPVGTGQVGYTGAGFTPNAMFVIGFQSTSYSREVVGNIDASFGYCDENTEHRLGIGMPEGGANFDCRWGFANDNVVGIGEWSANGIQYRGDFVSFDADGFTLDWLETAGAGRKCVALCLNLNQVFVGDINSRTDTTQTAETGVGFTPECLWLFAVPFDTTSFHGADDGPIRNRLNWSMGAAVGPAERAAAWGHFSKQGSGWDSYSGMGDAEIFASLTTAFAIDGKMDHVSMDADGFTFVMDNAEAVADIVGYMAMKPQAGLDARDWVLRYHENVFMSRALGRSTVFDSFGREVPPEQFQVDEWIRSDGAFFPTSLRFSTLILDQAAGYVEAKNLRGDLNISVSRESLLESLFRRLGRGA